MIDVKNIFNSQQIHTMVAGKSAEVMWTVSPELAYFEGHFPENPILPSVAVLDFSEAFLGTFLGKENVKIAEIKTAKFLKPIVPNNTLKSMFSIDQDLEFWTLIVSNQDGDVVCKMKFSIHS